MKAIFWTLIGLAVVALVMTFVLWGLAIWFPAEGTKIGWTALLSIFFAVGASLCAVGTSGAAFK